MRIDGDDDDLDLNLEDEDGKENQNGEQGDEDGREDAEGDERVEGQDDAQEDDEGQGAHGRVGRSPQGREAKRLATLRNENRQLAETLARQQRDLDELKASRQQPQQEDPRAEAARMELMTPEERIEYRFQQSERRNAATLANMQRTNAEATDRISFQALQGSSPVAKKYADEVERLFQQEFKKGGFVDRQTILKYVVGEKVLAKGASAAPKQRQAAARRLEQQTTRSGANRGDVQSERRGGKSLADRLADVII